VPVAIDINRRRVRHNYRVFGLNLGKLTRRLQHRWMPLSTLVE
jgi:hypothetical protein